MLTFACPYCHKPICAESSPGDDVTCIFCMRTSTVPDGSVDGGEARSRGNDGRSAYSPASGRKRPPNRVGLQAFAIVGGCAAVIAVVVLLVSGKPKTKDQAKATGPDRQIAKNDPTPARKKEAENVSPSRKERRDEMEETRSASNGTDLPETTPPKGEPKPAAPANPVPSKPKNEMPNTKGIDREKVLKLMMGFSNTTIIFDDQGAAITTDDYRINDHMTTKPVLPDLAVASAKKLIPDVAAMRGKVMAVYTASGIGNRFSREKAEAVLDDFIRTRAASASCPQSA